MRQIHHLWLLALITGVSCSSLSREEKKPGDNPAGIGDYASLNEALTRGWNTFDVTSISTQVLLPEGLALNLQITDTVSGQVLSQIFTGNRVEGSERVWTLAHTPDGSYTDFVVRWREFGLRLQTHAEGDDLYVLAAPADFTPNPGIMQLNASIHYGREGRIVCEAERLVAELPGRTIHVIPATEELDPGSGPHLRFSFSRPAAFSTTGDPAEVIREKISQAEEAYRETIASYGELSEVYNAVQNVLNWMVIYDDENDRLVTPVARPWAYGWGNGEPGGYILFCWDNFFAALLHSLESRELAFNEAIQMCREIDELGFVPNFSASNNLKSRDRSQPPVGGMMVREIYHRYPEKWFLERQHLGPHELPGLPGAPPVRPAGGPEGPGPEVAQAPAGGVAAQPLRT